MRWACPMMVLWENVEVTELKPILLGDYYQVSMFLSSLYLFK